MIDVNALAKPILDLLAGFGTGALPVGGPTDALRGTSAAVDQIHQAGRDSINAMNAAWDGRAADAATATALRVQTSAATISDRGNEMAAVVSRAAAEIETGQRELTRIVQSFMTAAASMGPALTTPPGLAMLVDTAIDHLGQALAVVGRVQNELRTCTASMSDLIPPPPTPPAAGGPGPGMQVASAASSALSGIGQMMSTSMAAPSAPPQAEYVVGGGGVGGGGGNAAPPPRPETGSSGAPTDGTGVKITLPDGSVVEAPNEQAATAVRSAMGALGTPYVWGGNSPGSGLDCSGLTKYAYGEAGVDLPRLAAEQGNGAAAVSPGDLMPGDLAIWDGHVAMVIGNGQLVEAGDPVQISSIRTENSGMNFHGFYRPTS
ncbi:C40 family peptidase [Nocardia sp. CNY236]|uniref:C40 family peptidase n=1 Tax=Nocardia sp. CNY236 TaxID=1169152 RepID=UPI0004063586|nr:C40 family peptidase [Nocardia sp. CNY236]